MFKPRGAETYTIQFYRYGPKKRDGKPVVDGDGKAVYARVRESTGLTSQRKEAGGLRLDPPGQPPRKGVQEGLVEPLHRGRSGRVRMSRMCRAVDGRRVCQLRRT